MYTLTLSQNWKISKSENSRKDQSYICFLEQQQGYFSLSCCGRVKIVFQLTSSNPTLQDILDRTCKHLVDKIAPIVSIHVHRRIYLPRIRVYIPFSDRKRKDVPEKGFLITSQSITFFSVNPKFTLIYQAILQWLKQQSKK